jgi:hypothetical protein
MQICILLGGGWRYSWGDDSALLYGHILLEETGKSNIEGELLSSVLRFTHSHPPTFFISPPPFPSRQTN